MNNLSSDSSSSPSSAEIVTPVAPSPRNQTPRAAIVTRYHAPTNHRGARIKVETQRGSAFFPHPYALSGSAVHYWAAAQMLARFKVEDAEKHGADAPGWGELSNFAAGVLPTGEHVFVALD